MSAVQLVGSRLVEIDDGPHLLCVTHRDEVNRTLLAFLSQRMLAGANV